MLPLAHIGHYAVWVAYALPVLLVIAGIAYSSHTAKKRERSEGRSKTPDATPADRESERVESRSASRTGDPSSGPGTNPRASSSTGDAPPGG